MNVIDFASSPLSLLPPLVALGLAIITRRVLLSLGVGILIGALLLANYSVTDAVSYTSGQVFSVFIADGGNSAIRVITHHTTAIADVSADHTCSIFPNPTAGKFVVMLNHVSSGFVEVQNATGKKVFTSAIQSETATVDIAGQPAGIYFVTIVTEAGVLTRKIVLTN